MRTHPRHPRVRNIVLADDVPRLADGGIALCHVHQRGTAFAGSFTEYLVKLVRRAAVGADGRIAKMISSFRDSCPKCGSVERYFVTTRNRFKCKRCAAHYSHTSGTAFSGIKMPAARMQAIIDALRNGESVLAVSRRLKAQPKTVSYIKARMLECDTDA